MNRPTIVPNIGRLPFNTPDALENHAQAELGRRSLSASLGQISLWLIFTFGIGRTRYELAWFVPVGIVILASNLLKFYLSFHQEDYFPRWKTAWKTVIAAIYVLSASAWGAAGFLLLRKFGLASYPTAIIVLIGSGLAAGVATAASPWKALARTVTGIVIGIPSLTLLIAHTRESLAFFLIFLAYWVFLWVQIGLQNANYWDYLRYRKSLVEENLRLQSALAAIEQTRTELQKEKVGTELAAKLAAIGEFTAGVVHEIRNPLTVIMMSLQMLKKGLEQAEIDRKELTELADRAAATTFRMEKIIGGLTRFSRKTETEPYSRVKLAQIIREAVDLAGPQFRASRVSLEVGRIDESIIIYCRPVEISQVLINVMTNALDSVKNLDKRWVNIQTRPHDESVTIAITDSGPGIPPPLAEKIFEPLFTTKPSGAGTGLGLSISRRITERHGGRLTIDPSAPHTTFLIDLPTSHKAA